MIALYVLMFFWWMASDFAGAVTAYRVWLKGDMTLIGKLLYAPKLIIFGVVDVLLNYTVFMVFGKPPKRCYTISMRFEYYNYIKSPNKVASWTADFICKQILNPLDVLSPTGRHC